MSREAGNFQACASCKHQRKKCDEACELAPYFPADRYTEFQNAHRLFGVSNILKILNSVDQQHKQAAAETILVEATARKNDPVHGCLGIAHALRSQIEFYEKQLHIANQYLTLLPEREKVEQQKQKLEEFLNASPLVSMLPLPAVTHEATMQPDDQLEEFKNLTPILPDICDEYIEDMKTSGVVYTYQPSTLEEGLDGIKPFDMQHGDQILLDSSYQHENILITSFSSEPREFSSVCKAHGKQLLECDGEANVEKKLGSPTKGKKDIEELQ